MVWGRRRKNDAQDLERAWRRGLRAAVEDRWDTVETWLERIVESDTDDLDAYHALARLYRRQGAVGRAIRMHQNLLLRSDLPADARDDAMLELARDFDAGGFAERAVASYEAALDRRPRDPGILERLIELLQDQQEYVRALHLLRRLRRSRRSRADALEVDLRLSQARVSLAEGDDQTARRTLKRALRRDPECAEAWTMLGEIEAQRGKNARALAAWKKAARADPPGAGAVYPRIEASFAARGRSADFEAFLREVLESRPQDRVARLALARTLASRGDAGQAIDELSAAVAAAPEDLGLHAELGRQLLAAGRDAEAAKAHAELLDTIERTVGEGPGHAVGSEGA